MQISFRFDGCAEARDIEFAQGRRDQIQFDAAPNVGGEGAWIHLSHIAVSGAETPGAEIRVVIVSCRGNAFTEKGQRFAPQFVHQQTRGSEGVVGFFFDQCACGDQ